MAVGIRTKLAGVTAEQFEQVRAPVAPAAAIAGITRSVTNR